MAVLVTKKRQQGFTLLELLIAVSLLAIGLLAAASMQGVAINANSFANKNSIATSIAQEVMETLMSLPVDSPTVVTAVTNAIWDLDPATAGTTLTIPAAGTYQALYTTRLDTPTPSVTTFIVTVNQLNPDGTVKKTMLTYTSFKRATRQTI